MVRCGARGVVKGKTTRGVVRGGGIGGLEALCERVCVCMCMCA